MANPPAVREAQMPWTNNPSIQSLRLQYNAAIAAHSAAKRALIEAMMNAQTLLPELVAAEAKAASLLTEIRAKLLAEVTEAITGGIETKAPDRT